MTYWIAATLLTAINAVSIALNLLMLPGNWIMVAALCLFLLVAGDTQTGPNWITVLTVAGLATVGEIIELIAGSARAAKAGATRRSMLLSLAASFALGIVGTFVVPVPVVGTALGAISGAALGAFAGAWLGETWAGTNSGQRVEISQAAMVGRLLGIVIKLTIGAAIFVIQLVSLWL
ncbi:MAG: DUF456 domain-containing protein [Fuerstiella sp.]|nr:DUF456 domain-containing protein [Fuerstiella sp.]